MGTLVCYSTGDVADESMAMVAQAFPTCFVIWNMHIQGKGKGKGEGGGGQSGHGRHSSSRHSSSRHRHSKIDCVLVDQRRLPFRDHSIDKIASCLYHIPHKHKHKVKFKSQEERGRIGTRDRFW